MIEEARTADLVIVSKVDELPAGGLEKVREKILEHIAPGVKIISATRGELPFDVVLGLQRASEDTIDERHTHHDEDHAEGREHSHEEFDTIVLRLGTFEREALRRGLNAVVRDHEVYRAKGFAAVARLRAPRYLPLRTTTSLQEAVDRTERARAECVANQHGGDSKQAKGDLQSEGAMPGSRATMRGTSAGGLSRFNEIEPSF